MNSNLYTWLFCPENLPRPFNVKCMPYALWKPPNLGQQLFMFRRRVTYIYGLAIHQWLVAKNRKLFLCPMILTGCQACYPYWREKFLGSRLDLLRRNRLEAILGRNQVLKEVKRLSDWVNHKNISSWEQTRWYYL